MQMGSEQSCLPRAISLACVHQAFRYLARKGAGAIGIVVAAHHLALDTKVAIKLLQPHMRGSAEAVARFVRAARVPRLPARRRSSGRRSTWLPSRWNHLATWTRGQTSGRLELCFFVAPADATPFSAI